MRICIDAGHGGHDSGATAKSGLQEKDLVLAYAQDLRGRLTGSHALLLTRKNDTFVGLSLRAQKANDWRADVFISLHANASLSPSANGAWIIHDDDTIHGKTLAKYIWNEMAKIPGITDEDPEAEIYPDNSPWVGNRELTVVSDTHMPAVLIELGFLTNTDDLEDLMNPAVRGRICEAIKLGVEKWGKSMGLHVDIDLEGDEPGETGYRPLYVESERVPVRAWRRPVDIVVKEEAGLGESAGSFALRTIRGLVESPEAKEAVTGVKRTLIFIVLGWIEGLLRTLFGVGDNGTT